MGISNEYHCDECGIELTDKEIEAYDGRCEDCEREWSNRLTAWRLGWPDAELDKLYSPTIH